MNETPVSVPVSRAVQQAYLWLVATLGGVATVALLVFAVATQSSADAERISGEKGRSSVHSLVGALAVTHGRPGSF
ncbi:hypothetical protein [Methylobacterium marchantiae]|uniref:Histidine kinase n=1 Tax=Methylobacterium marchantiae TaxID=600331 RepID=A0ABW3WT83_9HYPH